MPVRNTTYFYPFCVWMQVYGAIGESDAARCLPGPLNRFVINRYRNDHHGNFAIRTGAFCIAISVMNRWPVDRPLRLANANERNIAVRRSISSVLLRIIRSACSGTQPLNIMQQRCRALPPQTAGQRCSQALAIDVRLPPSSGSMPAGSATSEPLLCSLVMTTKFQ